MYLITELLLGGELLDAVLARGSYNEADARSCAVQLLRGIEYLHSRCAGMFLPGSWLGFCCAVQLLRGILNLHSRCAGMPPYKAWVGFTAPIRCNAACRDCSLPCCRLAAAHAPLHVV